MPDFGKAPVQGRVTYAAKEATVFILVRKNDEARGLRASLHGGIKGLYCGLMGM